MQKKARAFRDPVQVLQVLVQMPDVWAQGSLYQHVHLPALWDQLAKLDTGGPCGSNGGFGESDYLRSYQSCGSNGHPAWSQSEASCLDIFSGVF